MSDNPIGRPSLYTPELAKEICDKIAVSNQSLQTLCSQHDHWPSFNCIYEWLRDNRQGFGELYAKAKECQADYLADSILTIIDKPETYIDEHGIQHNDVPMMRLKVDSLKWQAMKLKPKKYGERLTHDVNTAVESFTKVQEIANDINKTSTSDI